MSKKTLLFSVLAGLGFYTIFLEPRRLVVRQLTLTLPRWPLNLDGFRIGLLSDLQIGSPGVYRRKIHRGLKKVLNLKPHLIVLLGDFVVSCMRMKYHRIFRFLGFRDPDPHEIIDYLQPLADHPRVFAVLGNHDYRYGAPAVCEALKKLGVRILENEIASLEWNGTPVTIAGLADLWRGQPDLEKVSRALTDHPAILITHNPDIFPDVPDTFLLTLAGHTHGGQVRLPVVGAPLVLSDYGQRYARGWIREGQRHLFVTTGIGTSTLPVRLGVPPEMVVLTLRRKG